MSVHAKFYIAEISQYASGNTRPGYADPAPIGRVLMRPVSRGAENTEWASATPAGEFTMTVRGSAFPWFAERIGQDVAITITDA